MDNTQTIITKYAKETQNLGEELAAYITGAKKEGTDVPHIVCLYGELGAGKTVFARGFAKGLGLPSRLVSPTFIIMKRYELKNSGHFFYHVDLYRLQKTEEIKHLGLAEIFNDQHAIVVVEWADRLGIHVPKSRIDIHFKITNNGERVITYG